MTDALAAIQRRIFGSPNIKWGVGDLRLIAQHFGGAAIGDMARMVQKWDAGAGGAAPATTAPVIKDSGSPIHTFVASTGSIDRMKDRLDPRGWNLGPFKKNPVILFGHDGLNLPIGRGLAAWSDGQALRVKLQLATSISTFAARVDKMLQDKFLAACSVGFIPVRWDFAKDVNRPGGIDFHAMELVELSIVPCPANSDCTLESIADSGSKSASTRRAADGSDWRCVAKRDLTIDSADDPWDAARAKALILDWASAAGTIDPEKAAQCFLATDFAAPLKATSYRFPFATPNLGKLVAAKTGWRAALAALEKSSLPERVIFEGRQTVDAYERLLAEQLENGGKSARLGRAFDLIRLQGIANADRAAVEAARRARMTPHERRAERAAEIRRIRSTCP
jgi:HK97 family phage prohead protease